MKKLSESGQGLVEYSIMLVLVAVVVIVTLRFFQLKVEPFLVFLKENPMALAEYLKLGGMLLGVVFVVLALTGLYYFVDSNWVKIKAAWSSLKRTSKDSGEKGQGLVEWALIMVLIAVVVIVIETVFWPRFEPIVVRWYQLLIVTPAAQIVTVLAQWLVGLILLFLLGCGVLYVKDHWRKWLRR